MPSINDLGGGKKKPAKAIKTKESSPKFSPGDVKSKIRSKGGLPPGFVGVVRRDGVVSIIQVDAKGREKVLSSYIPG